jgi:hypothetical protein
MLAALLISIATVCTAGSAGAAQPLGQATSHAVAGRLAIVEPSARRITLLPDDEVDLVTVLVAEDATIEQGERRLTLSDLVIQVGRRVIVHYDQADDSGRVTRFIIVEPVE